MPKNTYYNYKKDTTLSVPNNDTYTHTLARSLYILLDFRKVWVSQDV